MIGPIAADVSAYRAFRTDLRSAFATFQGPYVSIDVLLSWAAARYDSVSVAHDPRRAGTSSYTFRKLARHAFTMLTGFSTAPLRLASLIGLASTLFGLAILILVIVRYLSAGTVVSGFHVPRWIHCDLLGRPTAHARNPGRISRPRTHARDGSTGLCRPRGGRSPIDDNVTTGRAPCDHLPWDSEFWGRRIARVRGATLTRERLAEIDAWTQRSEVDCVYFLASADAPDTWRLAEAAGFRLTDVRLELECPAMCGRTPAVTRPADARDVETLVKIARTSHGITRFYADPTSLTCAAANSTRRGFAGASWRISRSRCSSSSMPAARRATSHATPGATRRSGRSASSPSDADARGCGLGIALTGAAVGWCRTRGLSRVTVVTQGRNVAAQRTFQRAGFVTVSTGLWFHRWAEDTA